MFVVQLVALAWDGGCHFLYAFVVLFLIWCAMCSNVWCTCLCYYWILTMLVVSFYDFVLLVFKFMDHLFNYFMRLSIFLCLSWDIFFKCAFTLVHLLDYHVVCSFMSMVFFLLDGLIFCLEFNIGILSLMLMGICIDWHSKHSPAHITLALSVEIFCTAIGLISYISLMLYSLLLFLKSFLYVSGAVYSY